MAKSLRSKREKRLRAIRREIVEPLYEQKESAKLAAQEAALAAPKLPVRSSSSSNASMDITTANNDSTSTTPLTTNMDVEMGDNSQSAGSLKPVGGVGKKSKKFQMGKGKHRGKGKGKGKGKFKRRHI